MNFCKSVVNCEDYVLRFRKCYVKVRPNQTNHFVKNAATTPFIGLNLLTAKSAIKKLSVCCKFGREFLYNNLQSNK